MKRLLENIDQEIKMAMIDKDEVRKLTLRAIKKEMQDVQTSKGGNGKVSESQLISILQKMIKQRTDSANIYQAQGRVELWNNELQEITVLEGYLPRQLTSYELEVRIQDIINRLGVTNISEMGKVMGIATKELAGITNGKAISETVKKLL